MLAQGQKNANDQSDEEQKLKEYMKVVSEETWAKDNGLLQTYLRTNILKSSLKPKRASKNTTVDRLGFSNNGYPQADLNGTNEITRRVSVNSK
jgi:hypothetical protein